MFILKTPKNTKFDFLRTAINNVWIMIKYNSFWINYHSETLWAVVTDIISRVQSGDILPEPPENPMRFRRSFWDGQDYEYQWLCVSFERQTQSKVFQCRIIIRFSVGLPPLPLGFNIFLIKSPFSAKIGLGEEPSSSSPQKHFQKISSAAAGWDSSFVNPESWMGQLICGPRIVDGTAHLWFYKKNVETQW